MIRSILYLDEQKLYSLSSQVFEGLTEYLLTEKNEESENSTTQKGPVASGRILADAIKLSNTSVERRVLHDHAFSLFENKLEESEEITNISESDGQNFNQGSLKSFVRVSAPASFIDAADLNNLFGMFNKIGEAIAYVTNTNVIKEANEALELARISTKDKHKILAFSKQLKDISDPAVLAKKAGLHQDPKLLENLSLITKFAFADQLELQQRVGDLLYTSLLKREYLREAESLIIRKYSRQTEKSLVILGLVTQTAFFSKPSVDPIPEPATMKEAVTNLVNHIATMETSLSGKNDNEIVIDPIAVYVSL
ncbi:DUF6414 family protein [Variovorax boronicumulans]|uniref:DUF6414 family protein n=1 Tax=Variovorax boronicumulans TaxID=436515 RepID=UPI0012FE6069|nr:hypothetical protein [Variovorax boronicumulans]